MLFEGILLAATLQIKGPDTLPRNIRNETRVSGFAQPDEGKPGIYSITIHKEKEGGAVGEEIEPITILPKKLILKRSGPKKFPIKFSIAESYEGPIFFCIKRKNDPGQSSGGFKITSRSCYRRNILAK